MIYRLNYLSIHFKDVKPPKHVGLTEKIVDLNLVYKLDLVDTVYTVNLTSIIRSFGFTLSSWN